MKSKWYDGGIWLGAVLGALFTLVLVFLTGRSVELQADGLVIQADMSEFTQITEQQARRNEERMLALTEELTNKELDIQRKKMNFEITEQLYYNFYHFHPTNMDVINKLEAATVNRSQGNPVSEGNRIQNIRFLEQYLNNFVALYEQCRRGMLSYYDIYDNFKYLIGDICNNGQVFDVVRGGGYSGAKFLCETYYGKNTLVGGLSDSSKNSCKKP